MDKYESRPIIYGTRDYPLMRLRHSQLNKEQSQNGEDEGLNKANEQFKGIQRHGHYVWHKENYDNEQGLPRKDISKKSK
jgi:hypothetical protein